MSMPAVFLDRDGTIIEDTGYPGDSSPIHFLPGAPEALRKLQKQFLLIIISNQSGVGRGFITLDEMHRVHNKILIKLAKETIEITDSYICPHAPSENCECRKPNSKMLINAAEKWEINLSQSYMIGDKLSDTLAGNRAGCKSILLDQKIAPDQIREESHFPDYTAPDLNSAAEWIINDLKKNKS